MDSFYSKIDASKYKLGSNALISADLASPSSNSSLITLPVAGALLIPQQEWPLAINNPSTLVSPIRGPLDVGTFRTGK